MREQPEKRAPTIEIIGDPAELAEALGQATRIGEELRRSNVFAGLNKAVVPSLAETIGGAATKSILGNTTAYSHAVELIRSSAGAHASVVAPQIGDALAGFKLPEPLPRSVTAAMIVGIDKARLDLVARAVRGSYGGSLPQFARMLQTLDFPKSVGTVLADAIQAHPQSSPTTGAVAIVVEQAIAVAEVQAVAEVIDRAFTGISAMPPEKKRALALEVAMLIAAFLAVTAVLADSKEMAAAGVTLGCASALVRVYWRLVGKLG